MGDIKAGVLDRIEQSFSTFIKNPIALVLPLIVFQVLFIELVPTFGMNIILGGSFLDSMSINSVIYTIISLGLIYVFLYLMLIIPLTLGIMKGVVDLINGKKIYPADIIQNGFSKIPDAFKVYWYMFAYAYLAPAICFIVSGLIVLYGLYFNNEIASSLGGIFMGISILYALIQGIYRGLKSTFALSGAMYEQDFSKTQFSKSISYTDQNWWRILGNFLLVGLIGSLISGLISGIMGSVSLIGNSDIDILSIFNQSEQSLEQMFGNMGNFNLISLIQGIISQIISGIITVFVMIFSVIFYLRLKLESGESLGKTHIIQETVSEEL